MREVLARTVLNRHKRRDEWFLDDYSVNPYRLCGFNCVYCYIHGGRYGATCDLAVKVNAPAVLNRELSKYARRGMYGFIALASATEPWMRLEERYEVTRRCLKVILRHRFPVHCLTKSPLILRDLDLLEEIDRVAVLPEDMEGVGRGVLVTLSLSSLDEDVARVFEPGAPSPWERLEALREVREAGLRAGAALIPVLPFISDSEAQLEEIVKAAKYHGADYVFVGPLTLYGEGKRLYYRVLERLFPELVPRYKRLFGSSFQPRRAYREKLEATARALCSKYNVRYRIL